MSPVDTLTLSKTSLLLPPCFFSTCTVSSHLSIHLLLTKLVSDLYASFLAAGGGYFVYPRVQDFLLVCRLAETHYIQPTGIPA